MNLGENLKRIRKENNLSQEQLAEQLGVSRQSVSKWEQNQAYPEMDKMLQLCKMFHLNMDDLLNQNVGEVNKEKQRKLNINKSIEDFLKYITKVVDMFSNMKIKERIKCILEQILIILVLALLFLVIGAILWMIVEHIINLLPYRIYDIVSSIIIDIYFIVSLLLGVTIWLHRVCAKIK